MNLTIKILSVLALIAVIIAAGVITIKTLTDENVKEGKPQKPEIVKVEKGERSEVKFAEPIEVKADDPIQPKYVPVNQPVYLMNLREEGKTYESRVLGKVQGQASKKDWGIRGTAYFYYTYGVESIGKIIKNDGVTIIEERSFGKVVEDVIVSKYDVGLELPDGLKTGLKMLGATIGYYFGTEGVDAGWSFTEGFIEGAEQVKIPFSDEMFDGLRNEGMLPKELDPQRVKDGMLMFAKIKDGKLLEGKKVRIMFKDGQGITRIEPLDGCKLSQQEIDVIKRTNYVMDHYLFPDQKIAPESAWDVNGDVFAGFLDPRLSGRVGGIITVMRISDFTNAQNEVSKRLRLVKGNISFTDNSTQGQAVTGQLNGIKGLCSIPNKYGVVSSATMSGSMIYKNVSTDHLLFEAEMTVTPRVEISYECEVK